MSQLKQFTTAARERAERPKPTEGFGRTIKVEIDGREIAFGGVSSGQMLAMIAMEAQGETARIATIINFFFSIIEKESDRAFLKSRLFDPEDEFGEEIVSDVVIHVLEEWGARPTQPSSDSSTTQQSTGESSTASSQVGA